MKKYLIIIILLFANQAYAAATYYATQDDAYGAYINYRIEQSLDEGILTVTQGYLQPGQSHICCGGYTGCEMQTNNTSLPGYFTSIIGYSYKAVGDQFFVGDAPPGDTDLDGITDDIDNCMYMPNTDQADYDQDGIGNVCDEDGDNDGMFDNVDLYPYDITDWTYKVILDYKVDGVTVGNMVETDRGDFFSVGQTWSMGEGPVGSMDYLRISADYQASTAFGDLFGVYEIKEFVDGGSQSNYVPDSVGMSGSGVIDDMQSSVDSGSATVSNQESQAQLMQQIIDGQISTAYGLTDGIAGIKDSIDGLASGIESVQSGAVDTEASVQDGVLDGVGSGIYEGYVAGDVPDTTTAQTDYETAVSNQISTSDLSTIKEQVGVELSGSVSSVSCQISGHTITFDFGKYNSIYSALGVAWLSLCYLFGFFLIIRG